AAIVGLCFGEALTLAVDAGSESLTFAAVRRSLSFCLARARTIHPGISLDRVAARWIGARELARMDVQLGVTASVLWLGIQLFGEQGKGYAGDPLRMLVRNFLEGASSLQALAEAFASQYPALQPMTIELRGAFDNRLRAFHQIADLIIQNRQEAPETVAM